MQKTLLKKMKNMIIITEIKTSCQEKKILLTYQFTRFRKDKDVFSIIMHRYQNNRNMF